MPRLTNEPLRTISVKIPRSLDERLTRIARRRHITRSALVREAVAAMANQPSDSALVRLRSLVGTVSGPRDLSTNPRYLKGLGENRRG